MGCKVNKVNFSGDSEEDRLLVSRVKDAIESSVRTYSHRFIGFLDLHQRAAAQRVLTATGDACSYAFWGGFEDAERVYLGLFGEGGQPDTALFPVAALKFTWKFGQLTHRDFLGALLSLGLKREKIGDITLGGNECTVLLDTAIAQFVSQNLLKVGGSGVSSAPAELATIKKQQDFSEITDTVASSRLDCVVAALLNLSRGQCEKLIQSDCVSLDFETAASPAAKVSGGATVSIRGHGRFIIDSIGPVTKKGRFRFAARRYL